MASRRARVARRSVRRAPRSRGPGRLSSAPFTGSGSCASVIAGSPAYGRSAAGADSGASLGESAVDGGVGGAGELSQCCVGVARGLQEQDGRVPSRGVAELLDADAAGDRRSPRALWLAAGRCSAIGRNLATRAGPQPGGAAGPPMLLSGKAAACWGACGTATGVSSRMDRSSQRAAAALSRMQERDGLRSRAGGRSQLAA